MVGGISFGGLATGLDTDSIVAQLVAIRSRPKFQLQQQKQDLSASLKVMDQLKAAVEKLSGAAEALDRRDEFVSKVAGSTDELVFTASAGSDAVLGNFDITVTSLAAAQREASQGYAATTDSVGSGTFSITVDGETTDITLAPGQESLADLKAAINDSGAAVTASIIFDGTSHRLLLSAEETGLANGFTHDFSGLSGGTAPTFTQTQAAADAALNVGGIDITSASNKVEGALEGVTLDLVGAGSASLGVTGDDSALVEKLEAFVDAYNAVTDLLSAQSQKGSQLNGSSLLRTVQSRLSSQLTSGVATGGDFRVLAEAGVELDRDGRLSLDRDKLGEALAQDYESVVNLFVENGGEQGVAARMVEAIDGLTDFADGLFKTGKDGIDARIEAIDGRIEREERYIESYRELLNRKFTAMEMAVSRMQSQSGFIGFGGGFGG